MSIFIDNNVKSFTSVTDDENATAKYRLKSKKSSFRDNYSSSSNMIKKGVGFSSNSKEKSSFTPKTTLKSKKRVVLGDISNRKQQNQSFSHYGKHNSKAKKYSNSIKSSFKSSSLVITSTPFEDSLGLELSNTTQRSKDRNKKISSRKCHSIQEKNNTVSITTKESVKIKSDESTYDDIERPAGRMWHEQHHSDGETDCSFDLEGCKEDMREIESLMMMSNFDETKKNEEFDMRKENDLFNFTNGLEELMSKIDNAAYEDESEEMKDLVPPPCWGIIDDEFRLEDITDF